MEQRLDFGETFSKVFDLYGSYAGPLLVWALVFEAVIAFVSAVLTVTVLSSGISGALLGFPILLGLAVIGGALLTGAYVIGLTEAEETGTFPPFGEVWPRVKPRLAALIGTSLLAGIGIAFGFVLLIVPGLILMTLWAVIGPIVMLEGRSGTAALARSRELVRGEAWTVFGLLIVTTFLTGIVSSILGGIVGGILGGRDSFLGAFGSQLVSGTLLAPISALLAVLIYRALAGSGTGGTVDAYGEPLPPATPPLIPPSPPAPPAGGDDPHAGPFV